MKRMPQLRCYSVIAVLEFTNSVRFTPYEPLLALLTFEVLTDVNQYKKPRISRLFILVGSRGFEPLTSSTSRKRSSQMS